VKCCHLATAAAAAVILPCDIAKFVRFKCCIIIVFIVVVVWSSLMMIFFTGSIARSANLPVFSLLRGQF